MNSRIFILFLCISLVPVLNGHDHSPLEKQLYRELGPHAYQATETGQHIKEILLTLTKSPSLAHIHTLLTGVQASRQESKQPELYKKAEQLLTATACWAHLTTLQEQLQRILDELFSYKKYWEIQHLSPWKFAFAQGPLALFKKETSIVRIKQSLQAVNNAIAYHATHLGMLMELQEQFQTMATHEELTTYCKEITLFIEKCINSDSGTQEEHTEKLNALFALHTHTLGYYAQKTIAAFEHKPPYHLARYWLAYATSATIGMGLSLYYYKNPKDVEQRYLKWKNAGYNFYQESIKLPLEKLHETFFSEYKIEKISPVQLPREIEEELFRKQIKDYILNNYSGNMPTFAADFKREMEDKLNIDPRIIRSTNKKVLNDALDPLVEKIVKEKNLRFMHPGIIHDTGNPVRIGQPRFVSDILLQVQQYKLILIDLVEQKLNPLINIINKTVDEVMNSNANRLNLQLIKTVPGALAAAVVIYSGKKIYNYPLLKAHKAIKNGLREITRTLNAHVQSSSMPMNVQGLIAYWTNTIKHYSSSLETEYRILLEQDLSELTRSDYSPVQKMNTATRMYRTYSFLTV